MKENFQINSKEIDKIKKITIEEKNFRIKNLEFFKEAGFPNKRYEDWKFSDFKNIINSNFDELNTEKTSYNIKKINLLKHFDHNYVFLVNGNLHSSNFDHEDKSKVKISSCDKVLVNEISQNPLVCLNHALAVNGFYDDTTYSSYKVVFDNIKFSAKILEPNINDIIASISKRFFIYFSKSCLMK